MFTFLTFANFFAHLFCNFQYSTSIVDTPDPLYIFTYAFRRVELLFTFLPLHYLWCGTSTPKLCVRR